MRSGWAVAAVFLGVVFGAPGARAQVTNTPNTLKLAKTESSPKARIADVAWLAGRWTGDFMGGKGEEVFAPPQGEASAAGGRCATGGRDVLNGGPHPGEPRAGASWAGHERTRATWKAATAGRL
ncbi:MAG: hypothetical protein H7X85_10215 [Thermoanaerobaculia bacterium]|nr:hypothetical protein [Thermoanaerobaculia bacterium]